MALVLKESTILMEMRMAGGSLSQIQFLVLFIWLHYDVDDFASHVFKRLVHIGDSISLLYRVPTSSGNHGKPGKSHKSSMRGLIMEFQKP